MYRCENGLKSASNALNQKMRSIALGMGILQIGFFCVASVWEKLKTLMRALINTVALGRAKRSNQ